jgi:hypothetical protein
MARIAGVATQKNAKGEITHVTIDLKKHKKAIPALNELGLIEKSKFDEEFEQGIGLEELRDGLKTYVRKIWKQ